MDMCIRKKLKKGYRLSPVASVRITAKDFFGGDQIYSRKQSNHNEGKK